ncbi:MAG: hypothetical protein GXY07_08670 [Candidatus Hydrogenedentes bacterium]|nr:hypothetical protein [Candidatus Hydrogenedentota bacterium]
MSILIVAGKEDAEARRAAEALRERKAIFSFLDTAAFPGRTRLSQCEDICRMGSRELSVPTMVYLRGLACHPLMPGNEKDLAERPRGFLAQCEEKRSFLESLLLTFERQGVRFVNSLEANSQHSRKPWQLRLLQDAGLPVPRWTATNDPAAVRTFARAVGPCVYKPLSGGATVRLLETRDLSRERLDALKLAPVLFQEYYAGVSVRAYVIGGRVIAAAEIRSEEVDYRRDEREVSPVRLTVAERRAAVTASRACGMAFTGVDLIRGKDGFRVLECNPSPMFAVFEQKTGLDIAGPLAELLILKAGMGSGSIV